MRKKPIYANASLNQALDNIFHHPTLPPFISRLLIQHLVTSDPSPAYIERVADVFVNNGQNIRGDMKAVIRAILLDPEARGNFKTAPRYGKMREPVQLVTNLGRIFPAQSADGQSITDGGLSLLDEQNGTKSVLFTDRFQLLSAGFRRAGNDHQRARICDFKYQFGNQPDELSAFADF